MRTAEKRFDPCAEKDRRIKQLELSLTESDSEVENLDQRIKQLEREIQQIRISASYKLARRIARALRQIAPQGTARRRVLGRGFRAIRALPKLRMGQWAVRKLMHSLNRSHRVLRLLLLAGRIEGKRFVGLERARVRAIANLPRFSPLDRVDASIIIPVFDHWRDSRECLDSIARLTSGVSYEVIIVDDGSTDETPELLKRTIGVVTLRNEQRLGFTGSCNRGAAVARGSFLVFLNHKSVVTSGWLEALARTFRDMPGTGLAGGKLIDTDGRLHEAGNMIWRDGTGWNYGKLDDAGHPKYNFIREVDYCSAACVMVPRDLFEQSGGFDPRFTRIDYAEADLAFKIHHAGRKVIYQPHATIIERERAATSTAVKRSSDVTSFPEIGQTFRERWSHRLASQPPAPFPESHKNAQIRSINAASRGRVLVIDHRLPFYDQDAGSLRMMEMIRALVKSGQVVTFVPSDLLSQPGYLESLQSLGVEAIHQPYYRSVAEYLKEHGREFGLAIVCRLDIAAAHMTTVRRLAPNAKIVYDTVDLHFLREEREARVKQDDSLQSIAASRKRQELELAMRADLSLVVSSVEKEILEKECPGIDVRILSTIHTLEQVETPGFDARRNIIFIGSFQHAPNADAVLYFARDILPLIHKRLPEAVFQVIGAGAPPEVLELESPTIEIRGHVPDVTPLFHRALVSVAPLRFGAGVKGKVNQSMALGVPTVVTPMAAEGMYLVHEHNAMIADDPIRFADAVVRLATNREQWERISANGRENVREHFSVKAASKVIDELLTWAGLPLPD